MNILQDHKLTIVAGFVLTAILIGIATATGGGLSGDQLLGAVARWGHFLAGITWIGLLYYFNFVQVPSLGGVSADTKADLFKEGSIVRRALFWFRFAAMFTVAFGLLLLLGLWKQGGAAAISTDIMIGATFGIIMWINVAFIIWPNQKKVIGIVEASADEKAAAGKKALMASRINTLLSIPMLFFMASSAHFPIFN
ncbi:MAG: urate hydroxylase PuuD [Mariprofundus sp.]|nr:urate hydroxylase PuuD [Mariprofundus sp.]